MSRLKKLLVLIALMASAVVVFFVFPREQFSGLKIIYLDIGQGDASLIVNNQGQKILIDCGPDQAIVQALDKNLAWWDKNIDLVIISHDHLDHWGGLNYLINKYHLQKILLATPVKLSSELKATLESYQEQGIIVEDIYAPSVIYLADQSKLTVLWPTIDQITEFSNYPNNQSLVILWQYGQTYFLWTGDLENEAEQQLINKKFINTAQSIDILKVGHHGSRTASNLEWINYWRPSLAVISVGLNNSFQLPSQIILDRFHRLGIKVWRTDLNGQLVVFSNGRLVWR